MASTKTTARDLFLPGSGRQFAEERVEPVLRHVRRGCSSAVTTDVVVVRGLAHLEAAAQLVLLLGLHQLGGLGVRDVLLLLPLGAAVLEPYFHLETRGSNRLHTFKGLVQLHSTRTDSYVEGRNQAGKISPILTCCSVTLRSLAMSALSEDERYFLFSNIFSSSNICRPVNVVRT